MTLNFGCLHHKP